MPVPSGWHPGEIAAQKERGYEDDVWGIWQNYQQGAPSFMIPFLNSLPFLSVTTLDQDGMPWTSLISNDGQDGFLEIVPSHDDGNQSSRFKCIIRAPVGIPIRECLLRLENELSTGVQPYDENGDEKARFQLAAVGVMLHNRRRNKMDGVIVSVDQAPKSDDEDAFTFHLDVTSTFGNCPKYINTRYLIPADPGSGSHSTKLRGNGSHLPPEVLQIISSADMLFLASKHSGDKDGYPVDPSRLGNNIRGGPPGFLRTFFDEEAGSTCIVLPDWSGNRMMMSLGNITGDPVAGITIPVWSNKANTFSTLLHITCSAKVLANEEASNLIRGVNGALKLWPQSWTLVFNSLPLFAAVLEPSSTPSSEPQENVIAVGWSPYNPPVRLLNSEKPSLMLGRSIKRPTATLVDAHFYSPKVATLTFECDQPLPYTPGQHIILDCYNILDTRVQLYTHMSQYRGGEKDLNDDGTRSWTISYAKTALEGKMQRFEVTLRRKDRGGVTPNLFHQAKMLRDELDGGSPSMMNPQVEVIGVDGSSLLPDKAIVRLAYVVSGIGLTPMLPHLSQLVVQEDSKGAAEVLAVMAVKWNEIELTKRLIRRALSREGRQDSTTRVHVQAFLLAGAQPDDDEAKDEGDQEGTSNGEDLLPANVTFESVVITGKRFGSTSLSSQGEEDEGFLLPSEFRLQLEQADQIVVCAGPAFAKTAQEALRLASIPSEKIKMESFAF